MPLCITHCFKSSKLPERKPYLVLGSNYQDEAMVQDIILRVSWKALWETSDHPCPIAAASIRFLQLTALPFHVFGLLTSLRTLPSQSLSPPMTGGSEEKIRTDIMLFNARAPKQLQEAVAGSGYPTGLLSTCPVASRVFCDFFSAT